MADNQEQQQHHIPPPPPPPIHRYLGYKATLAQIAEAEAEAEAARDRKLLLIAKRQQRRTAKLDRRPPRHLIRKFDRNERLLLAVLSVVLWWVAWVIVCLVKCSASDFFYGDITTLTDVVKLVAFNISPIVQVFIIYLIYNSNYTLRIASPILIILTGGCCTFGFMGTEVVSDWYSALVGLLLSLYTIPLCRLLQFTDNICIFEASVGMSAAALLSDKCIGKNGWGWTAVFAYLTSALFVKYQIGIWFEKNDIRKALEEEE